MHLRNHKVVLALVLTAALVLGLVGTAFASWSDLTTSILGDYGITESEVAQISDGYTDGNWKPYADMQRRQFVKMADDAYGITLVSPATPTYTDVPASDDYYPYVEGATAAGLVNGIGGGLFAPMDTITREEGAAIIARYVADDNGYDLDSYYADPEAEYASFADAGDVSESLVEEMAFAVDFGIVEGNAFGDLDPQGTMTRIQGAAMLIRSWGIVPEATTTTTTEPAATTTTTTEPAATTTTTTEPVVDSVTLSPESGVNFADAAHTVTATLYDQFDELYAQDATVTFTWQQVEDKTVSFTADVLSSNGEASYTPADASVAAGAWDITAEVDGVSGVIVAAGLGSDFDGKTFEVVVNGVVRGSAPYNNTYGKTVTTTWTFTSGDEVFIHFPFSTREDDLFDWFCATTPYPVVVDSVTLSPTSAVNFSTDSTTNADHTVTATLYDQFGELYAQDATVTFTWRQVEDATVSFTADVSSSNGEASYTYTPDDASVAAGAWDITAEVDGVTGVITSNIATKYWASN